MYKIKFPCLFSTGKVRNNHFDLVRLRSVIELDRTHRKVPVRLCSITEPIEIQSNDWIRLGLIDFWFGFVRLTMPGLLQAHCIAIVRWHSLKIVSFLLPMSYFANIEYY